MDVGNLLVAFFIIVIFLTLISLAPLKGQTDQFLMKPNTSIESAFVLIVISISMIFFIKVPKKYYRPIPSRA
jgi:predicted CDP-diglyceride synthetase/phosphatidate cytidylyltransferase